MSERAGLIACLALARLFLSGAAMAQSAQSAPRESASISESDIAYPYRLFATANVWTFYPPRHRHRTRLASAILVGRDTRGKISDQPILTPAAGCNSDKRSVYSLFDSEHVQLPAS
jgi:hypothetical protein